MSKTFNINFTGDTSSVLDRAKQAATKNGVQFNGDTDKGAFSGKGVEGSYTVSGNTVSVTVDKKPMVAPWSMVESQLKQFFQ